MTYPSESSNTQRFGWLYLNGKAVIVKCVILGEYEPILEEYSDIIANPKGKLVQVSANAEPPGRDVHVPYSSLTT